MADLDYLSYLARESARFASAMDTTAPGAAVPTCPGWTADDLLWHLGEVQWFWGTIVRDRADAGTAEAIKPPRPASRPGLMEFYISASSELGSVLAITPVGTPVWTWADDKTAGFVRRRQAHEALIHRLDAELTAGSRSVMDPVLSADGVDEALRIIYGGDLPSWGTFTADETRTVRFRATDTGDSWLVTLGQFSGTDPDTQQVHDDQGIQIADADQGTEAAATLSGSAADLDCWLWRRPALSPVARSGSSAVLDAFDAFIAAGVN